MINNVVLADIAVLFIAMFYANLYPLHCLNRTNINTISAHFNEFIVTDTATGFPIPSNNHSQNLAEISQMWRLFLLFPSPRLRKCPWEFSCRRVRSSEIKRFHMYHNGTNVGNYLKGRVLWIKMIFMGQMSFSVGCMVAISIWK